MSTVDEIGNQKNLQRQHSQVNNWKNDTSIPFKVGIKQGDSMAPVLVLFIKMEFAEMLENNGSKMIFINHNFVNTIIPPSQKEEFQVIQRNHFLKVHYLNYSVCYTQITEHLLSNLANKSKQDPSSSNVNLVNSESKCMLAAIPKHPKLKPYSFHPLNFSNNRHH